MTKTQSIVLSIIGLLFVVLYFGCETKPKEMQLAEKSRASNIEVTGFQTLMIEAKKNLSKNDKDIFNAYNVEMTNQPDDSSKVKVIKKIAAKWYNLGQLAISGNYAEEIAKIEDDENSWSIAGTTYVLCTKASDTEKMKQYCQTRSVKCFENAISHEPGNLDNKVNLALSFVEYPPADNPMKGILMLIDLNKKNPDNVSVLNQLGRLGMQTNQFEKAAQRLEKAINIEPNNKTSICLLAKAYKSLGRIQEAEKMEKKCNDLNYN